VLLVLVLVGLFDAAQFVEAVSFFGVVAVVAGEGPAHAVYWSRCDGALADKLEEGYKVCDAIAQGYDFDAVISMNQSDLSVSPAGAGTIYGAATVGLGC
jgi:Protein of unknown function (DUF732)